MMIAPLHTFGYLKQRFGLPIPWQFPPLQDCVDLSIFLVRTTIELPKTGRAMIGWRCPIAVIT